MALNPIPKEFQKLWEIWDIRFFVLFSLLLQVILIFMAPLRKKMPQRWVTICIWSAYLLADAVAIFCVGLISNSQGNDNNSASKPLSKAKNEDLLAFWATFLLLHLGGPDTITAFALEDNELWIRHLLGLVIQLVAVIYVFLQSLPENKIWVPTCVIFVAGFVKYAERSCALYLASLKRFRESMLAKPDPGPNYAKLMNEYAWTKENLVPAKIKKMKKPEKNARTNGEREFSIEDGSNSNNDPSEIGMVEMAYVFFNKFKGLIVDLSFSFQEREDSRRFFLDIANANKENIEKAYRMVEIELNFIYDVLYTKAYILHSPKGYFLRFMAFTLLLVAFFLFVFNKKDNMHQIDIAITYALLIGAISLETVALVRLIFSDWTIALLKSLKSDSKLSQFTKSFFSKILSKSKLFNKSRWSESISQFSLLNFCLSKRQKWLENIVSFLRVKDLLDEIQYNFRTPLSPELKEFMFKELKTKSEKAINLSTTKEICSSRGIYFLKDDVKDKLEWSFEVEYDASLLIWHIATDMLYHHDPHQEDEVESNSNDPHQEDEVESTNDPHQEDEFTNDNYREFCKVLSDYMLYLLVIQPTVISAIASTAQTRYRDTCAEAENFFGDLQNVQPETNESKSAQKPICGVSLNGEETSEGGGRKSALKFICGFKLKAKDEKLKESCGKLLDVNTLVKPSEVKGDRSKSVLFDGVMLAKDLQGLPNKWKIMSQVWLELLCYAASHCKAINHAQHVSKGGELITLLWLLMIHFGLGEQFSITAWHNRAKLIIGKYVG